MSEYDLNKIPVRRAVLLLEEEIDALRKELGELSNKPKSSPKKAASKKNSEE